MQKGVAECRTWLEDLIRRGLAAAQADDYSDWDRVAARMVDAQAPGLAGYIHRIPQAMSSGEGWEVRTLELLGRLHLLLTAAARLNELPGALGGDVRVALGYNQPKDEVLDGPGVTDRWTVLGQAFEDDNRLTVRRTWLWGKQTSTAALVLDFAVGGQPLDASLVPGMAFDGEVVFYPSRAPLRALVKSRGEGTHADSPVLNMQENMLATGLHRFAQALGANPWLTRWPLVLPHTQLARAGERWVLRQGTDALPLSPAFERGIQLWRLLSATGGREATIIAEWDGETAVPVGLFVSAGGTAYVKLATRWAA